MASLLIVDDSSAVRNSIVQFLNEHGIECITASNGLEGIEQLKANPGIKLIITDIMMPEMTGLEMLDKIRNEVGNQEVKVLI
ncbi:MAG: response regulator, partial [SAR324 cluster bacterium]|nr:response regulator [SAR324 cluster bacterium]